MRKRTMEIAPPRMAAVRGRAVQIVAPRGMALRCGQSLRKESQTDGHTETNPNINSQIGTMKKPQIQVNFVLAEILCLCSFNPSAILLQTGSGGAIVTAPNPQLTDWPKPIRKQTVHAHPRSSCKTPRLPSVTRALATLLSSSFADILAYALVNTSGDLESRAW